MPFPYPCPCMPMENMKYYIITEYSETNDTFRQIIDGKVSSSLWVKTLSVLRSDVEDTVHQILKFFCFVLFCFFNNK